jgi:hypothetical protein
MRWDRIDLLLNRIKDDLVEKGYVIGSTKMNNVSN